MLIVDCCLLLWFVAIVCVCLIGVDSFVASCLWFVVCGCWLFVAR